MVIIHDKIELDLKDIENLSHEDVEKVIKEKVNESLCKKMEGELENLSFIDMEPGTDNNVAIKSSVVISSLSDVETMIQMITQNLAKRGLDAEAIEAILEPMTDNYKGF